MNYQIRPAQVQDTVQLVQFNQALARETEAKELDTITLTAVVTALFTDRSLGFYTVVETEGQVVACALITYEWSDWRNSPVWWIQSVYVMAEHRRQGLFRMLYQYLRQAAQRQRVSALRLYVDRENVRAKATYAALGMEPSHYDLYEEYLD